MELKQMPRNSVYGFTTHGGNPREILDQEYFWQTLHKIYIETLRWKSKVVGEKHTYWKKKHTYGTLLTAIANSFKYVHVCVCVMWDVWCACDFWW